MAMKTNCYLVPLACSLALLVVSCASKPKPVQPIADEPMPEMAAMSTEAPLVESDVKSDFMNPDAVALPAGPESMPAMEPYPGALARPGGVYTSSRPGIYPTSPTYPDAAGYAGGGRTYSGSISGGSTYTVKSGDSLWRIARRSGTTVSALAAANNISPSAVLRIGQKLVVPGGGTAGSSVSSGSTAAPGEYIVRAGDSYDRIARRHGTTAKKLMELNNTTSDKLRIGQTIRVPQ